MAEEEEKNERSEKAGKQQSSEAKLPEEAKQDEAAELKDRLLRLAAEFDNYKKRSSEDASNAKGIGKAELAKALLPALDEFELALSAFGAAGHEDHMKGIELVFSNILATLRGSGMKEIEAKGKYDPYRHEVVMTRESKEPEGTILDVVRKGYAFNGALLRPSAVIVSKGAGNGDSGPK